MVAVAAYGYFGLGSMASTTYSDGATVIAVSTLATNAPAYPGFDLFNRVVDLPWVNGSRR